MDNAVVARVDINNPKDHRTLIDCLGIDLMTRLEEQFKSRLPFNVIDIGTVIPRNWRCVKIDLTMLHKWDELCRAMADDLDKLGWSTYIRIPQNASVPLTTEQRFENLALRSA